MDLEKISLEPIRRLKVAVLGYGNQGHAHALNLRDSGVSVVVGARDGAGFQRALQDGFSPVSIRNAAETADVLMFLFADQVIPEVYRELIPVLQKGKTIGFAHGFSFHFGLIEPLPNCSYFLAGPKGAGAILRERYVKGSGLPGVYAVHGKDPKTEEICLSYAKAIGLAKQILIRTTFQEETECDLFGEQAVLCGGIFTLMEKSFNTLTKNGHTPEMAFFETCYEARLILELWMKYGPKGVTEKISPTAFYGGLTRGQRLIDSNADEKLDKMFQEIRSGEFAKEWMEEVRNGMPSLKKKREELKNSALEKVYQELKEKI